MAANDPMLEQIATYPWPRGGVHAGRVRGGYTLTSVHTGAPVARLKPLPSSDHFEVLWRRRDAWGHAGPFGAILPLDDALWKAEGELVPVSAEDQAALAAKAEAQAAGRERVAREEAGARLAAQLLAGARPADASHPYLAAKGIEAHGLQVAVSGQTVPVQAAGGKTRNVTIAGRLLVPLHDVDGEVCNVQTIAADGTKLYLGGAQKMGTFHLLGELRAGAPVIVAEGYATGATVHRATGMEVAVALDTSNLMAVATALRDQDPARVIHLAADNDHHLPLRAKPLPNAGREKAEAAAAAVGGTVLLPEPAAGQVAKGKGTDWNDYEASHGQAVTRAALRAAGSRELAA